MPLGFFISIATRFSGRAGARENKTDSKECHAMKTIKLSDMTLRQAVQSRTFNVSFKERIEIARSLDRLHVDVLELPAIQDPKADVLASKTIASVVGSAALSATCGMTEEGVEQAWESVKGAKKPMLHVMAPVSAIQMEYQCHKKAPAMAECIRTLVAKARYYTEAVEFSAVDATRAERPFLYEAVATAIAAGAAQVTVCDSAGVMIPGEWTAFLSDLYANVPELKKVEVGVQISDMLKMSVASAAAAVQAGAGVVKVSIADMDCPSLVDWASFVGVKGDEMGIATNLRTTELSRSAKQLQWLLQSERSAGSPFDNGVSAEVAGICLSADDGISELVAAVHQLGYDLSEEDAAKVYEAFKTVAEKKHFVGSRELEAIIASAALQVPSTYHITDYVITNGASIGAMANLTLERDGEKLTSVANGDGPVDAAFLAIEQAIGHHYELDDFQIQTVTEGREAMGSALVKLRSGGKLYSGSGLSTDIIGASIRAYISALNKIVYEEV